MRGYDIRYNVKSNLDRTKFHHKLFGRLITVNYKGKKHCYYKPGMLDKTLFSKIMNGLIFVTRIDDLNLKELEEHANVQVYENDRDERGLLIRNGEDYWKNIAREKNLPLKRIRK